MRAFPIPGNIQQAASNIASSVSSSISQHRDTVSEQSVEREINARSFANENALSYPHDITSNALGYVRYDIYPHRQDVDSHQSYSHMNLHMPAEIGDALEAEWSADSDMLNSSLALGKRFIDLQDRVGSVRSYGDAGDAAKAVISAGVETADLFAGKIGDAMKIPFLDALTKPLMRRKRRATNPHEAHFFQDVSFRTFEFTHKLIPFSREESEIIRKICHWFRFFAAPRKANSTHYEYPAEWHIGFYNQDKLNPYLPQIYRCVLTGVNVNYTGSSTWSMHPDGAPTDVEITLTFTETVKPTRDIIHQEINTWNKTIGPRRRNAVIGSESDETTLSDVLGSSVIAEALPGAVKDALKTFAETWNEYGGVDTPNKESLWKEGDR